MRFALTIVLGLPWISQAQQIAMEQYVAPNPGAVNGITRGPDGALWFTQGGSDSSGWIGRATTAGAVTEFLIPNNGDTYPLPEGITEGPDGALWFTEFNGNQIGRITAAGAITEFLLPTPNSEPFGITVGPDGALWFTESGGGIGRITTTGAITEYPVAGEFLTGIATGPDGALWFNESNAIGRMTTDGSSTQYTLPSGMEAGPGITKGPDGELWFTVSSSGEICSISTKGRVRQYAAPGPQTIGITVGPDGELWFTAPYYLGRLTPGGAVTQYLFPGGTTSSDSAAITTGPDGEIWFSQVNSVGDYVVDETITEAVFVAVNLSVSPGSGYYESPLTFTGSGFAPNEDVEIYTRGVGSTVLAHGTADGTGSFTATASVPVSPYGPRIFMGVGQTSGDLGAANFVMLARLGLDPDSGSAGSQVQASGYGFEPFDTVKIFWDDPRVLLGTVVADENGTFALSGALDFTVPANAPTGSNGVFGYSVSIGLIGPGSFTVE
jgi:virginiamycin B lyase